LYDEVVVGKVASPSSVARYYPEGVPGDDDIHACLTRAWDAAPE
jgi:hypothetical protein